MIYNQKWPEIGHKLFESGWWTYLVNFDISDEALG